MGFVFSRVCVSCALAAGRGGVLSKARRPVQSAAPPPNAGRRSLPRMDRGRAVCGTPEAVLKSDIEMRETGPFFLCDSASCRQIELSFLSLSSLEGKVMSLEWLTDGI